MVVLVVIRRVHLEHDHIRLNFLGVLDDLFHQVFVDVGTHLAVEFDGVDHGNLLTGVVVVGNGLACGRGKGQCRESSDGFQI